MPVIYGRTYKRLLDVIKVWLANEVEDFLVDGDLRVVDLADGLAHVIHHTILEVVPNVGELSSWLKVTAKLLMDKGLKSYWFTPNRLAVDTYVPQLTEQVLRLDVAGKTVTTSLFDEKHNKVNQRKTMAKLAPDFIQSMDAAFLQQFVSHWSVYGHPLATVHDCFGTTLEHVETLGMELRDQWNRFYSIDHLARHWGVVTDVAGEMCERPPHVGTLNPSSVGENPFLFC